MIDFLSTGLLKEKGTYIIKLIMKIFGLAEESVVDGPGIRYSIFFQGCSHHCFNCHNKDSWDFSKGKEYSIDEMMNLINKAKYIDGVTLTGGDPLDQYENALELSKRIKKERKELDIILYTGYTYEKILESFKEILDYVDYVVDGLFVDSLKDLTLLFRGSKNQRFINVKKSKETNSVYEMSDLEINMI